MTDTNLFRTPSVTANTISIFIPEVRLTSSLLRLWFVLPHLTPGKKFPQVSRIGGISCTPLEPLTGSALPYRSQRIAFVVGCHVAVSFLASGNDLVVRDEVEALHLEFIERLIVKTQRRMVEEVSQGSPMSNVGVQGGGSACLLTAPSVE